MKKNKISLVFFGSGPVAAESLRLLALNFDIEAVITKPSTKKEMQSVCPETPLLTVANRSELDSLISEHKFSSKLAVLIDFGIIVSQKVIDSFEMGIINSHFSLLPELRGADPISFAILEAKEKTGVSLMLVVEAMDEGPVLATAEQELNGSETTPELTSKLVLLSDALLADTIPSYLSGEIKPANQIFIEEKFNRLPSYTRKLTKSDGDIDWSKPAMQIEREIRAYTGWPKSKANFSDIECIIVDAKVDDSSGEAGKLFIKDKKLGVYCGDKSLLLEKLKPAGKKEMNSQAFLAGYKDRIFDNK